MDKIQNWTEKVPKHLKNDCIKDKTYPKTLIKNNSMILAIGMTGSGKTNSIVEYLSRTQGKWYNIIIFTGSNPDEPIYNYLKEAIPDIIITNDLEELPTIEQYADCDKTQPKLIIFDDSVLSEPKTLKIISKWYMCARKLCFTCIFLAQDYHKVPVFIRRNVHYLQLFKMTDRRDLTRLFDKVAGEIPIDTMLKIYEKSTLHPGQFLTINLRGTTPKEKFKSNFIGNIF